MRRELIIKRMFPNLISLYRISDHTVSKSLIMLYPVRGESTLRGCIAKNEESNWRQRRWIITIYTCSTLLRL